MVEKRDKRRNGFAQVICRATTTTLAGTAGEELKVVTKHGITGSGRGG